MNDRINKIIDDKPLLLTQVYKDKLKLELAEILSLNASQLEYEKISAYEKIEKISTELVEVNKQHQALNIAFNAIEVKNKKLTEAIQELESKNKTLSTSVKELQEKNILLKQNLDRLKNELKAKFNKNEYKTISYQLGESIIHAIKNPRAGLRSIPDTSIYLMKESARRRSRKKNASKVEKILGALFEDSGDNLHTQQIKDVKVNKQVQQLSEPEKPVGNIPKDLSQRFPGISYEYGKELWPTKAKDTKFIHVLDEISEASWSEEFKLFRLVRKSFARQIEVSTAHGLFLESCWNGNSGEWIYAFTSPELKHQNAQDLLKAMDIAKAKGLPILFWNKEDPMHYDKFLPIAQKCDIIFTTDTNKVESYKKDLNNDSVYTLPFAANPYICNPMNRSRYQEESICFAGSYYSVGHDARKQQMDEVLPALLNLEGVIYDRMSKLNNERYYFPEKYQSIIRDSVNFKDMTALYKHFKLFLNVNTITDSPSMMSRRVYELLACGTPVISTPSKALEEQFPNIVQIAESSKDVERIAKQLLDNPWEYARLSHVGYREVMLHHTYENRKGTVLSALGIEKNDSTPLVSIILPTMRPHFIDRIVSNIGNQTYSNVEAIIVTQNYSDKQVRDLQDKLGSYSNITCKIIENNSAQNLGARLNQAVSLATGEFIAKFDDDDLYFPNYITDMMLPFKFGKWSVVGKKEGFFYLEGEDKLIVKYPNQRHIDTDFVMGATLIIRKSDLIAVGGFLEASKGEDSDLLKRMKKNGKKVYATDPFNFVVWRSKDSSSHSWDINKEFYQKNCDYIGNGLMTNIIEV